MDKNDSSKNLKIQLKKKKKSVHKQNQPVSIGLDGPYWNVVQTGRRTRIENDFTSKSKGLTGEKLQHRSVSISSSSSSSSSSVSSTDLQTILYRKKCFITCLSPTNSFFLCQILENIYEETKQVRIRWCSVIDKDGDDTIIDENTRFKLDYKDTLDINSILMEIKHIIDHTDNSISLRKQDIIKTNRLLKKSIKSDETMNLTTDNLSTKKNNKSKRKLNGKAAPIRKRRRTKDINEITEDEEETPVVKKTRISTKTAKKPGIISKARLFKVQSNRFLKENPSVKTYQIDPFFEDNVPVPFISSSVQSKLAIRAVILNDGVLLQSLIDDIDRVCSVHIRRDLPKSLSAIHYAIKYNNINLLAILLNDLKNPKTDRCIFPEVTIEKQGTGRASINTLGFRTAEIMASRGAREGNNALIKDTNEVLYINNGEEIVKYAIRNNCSNEIYDLLSSNFYYIDTSDRISECIQTGHRKLATHIMNPIQNVNHQKFSKLHNEVLSFDQEELTVNSAGDVITKSKDNSRLTPIHCAAINPNSKYLKQLLTIVSEYNIVDKYEKKPIHYAAACEGSEPLEYLLSKNVDFNDIDKDGNSPLHIAVKYGRVKNVEVLLHIAKEKAESDDINNQEIHEKFGLASINRMNKSKYYPLHLAALNNHLDCTKILLEYDARIDVFTSISTEKLTPLMLACQNGYLDLVLYLIENGARVESRDRFKRTPLIHACMYGHTHIVSHLLRLGANPNVFDSSMNTALHYAIAYGWYFCVELLIENGANPTSANCWQTTCLGIAFSKGHYGICDYLLKQNLVDINFKTDDGLTLVMITVNLEITISSVQQLEYVAIKHQADCTCIDIHGQNAFHYLALNQTYNQLRNNLNEKEEDKLRKSYLRMAQILYDGKCNPIQMDNKAQTPLINALQSNNSILVDFFLNHIKLELNCDISHVGKTLLHYFAIHCDNDQLIQILINLPLTNELKKMSEIFDNDGRTPFHYCILKFNEFCQRRGYFNGNDEQNQYQSIVNMIRYCLEILECDPDLGIKSIHSESNDENLQEKNIFYLLRTVSFTTEHPLDIFLKRTKNLNVLHHQTHRTALLEAIHLREYQTIDRLLQHPSCDINLATPEDQQTPLILACKLQFLTIIRNLLSLPKCDLLIYDKEHNQAFHYFLATSQRSDEYLEIFRLFIEKFQSIDKNLLNNQGKSNRTPLHISIYHNLGTVDNTNEIEQTLIDNECNVFIQDNLGNLPLHNIFLKKNIDDDPVELCSLLIRTMKYQSIDTKNNQGNTPLHLAVTKASTVCIMLLLKHGADLLIENNLSNSIIATCIASNHLNLLITFLQQPIDIDLSKLYTESNTTQFIQPFLFDIDTKQPWTWKYITKSTNTNKSIEKYSLIHLIIQRNWQGALSLILDDLERFHLDYIQIFLAAIFNNRFHLVLRLLSTIKDQNILNQTNSHGQNLFHIMSNNERYDREFFEKFLNFLDEKNVLWNIPDKYGSYPLHYACVIQNKPFIEFLLRKYSNELNFNQTDAYGNTAYGLLFWSLPTKTSFDKEFLRQLITSGECINCLCNYDNEIPIDPLSFGYIKSSSVSSFTYPPMKSNIRTSPLINAIIHDNFELAKFLLELDADVNYPDEEQRTPLMHAVLQNNIDMVKLLFNRDYRPVDKNQNSRNMFFFQPLKTPKRKRFFLGVDEPPQSDSDDSNDQLDTDNIPKEMETTDDSSIFPIKSSINLNTMDKLGRTCIHYLVQPFPDGSYLKNIELLELLHQSGVSLTTNDHNGLSPLQYSINNGCQHLYEKLLELINQDQTKPIQAIKKEFHINDPNQSLLGELNFYSDAQQFIDQYISTHSSELQPNIFQVDPLSNMSQTGEVMIDLDKNEPYDVRLTITDIDYGLIGLYNFYRMQIIKHKSKTNFYLLFTRWGRIGDGNGQHQLTPYSSFDECRQEFCKIFRDKTGNQWENTNQFEIKPKKYTLIELNKRQYQRYINVPIDFQQLQDDNQSPPSKLQSSAYKNFFQIFLNPQAIRTNLAKSQLDIEWMPVSQLRSDFLQKAYHILFQLKAAIQTRDQLKLIYQKFTSQTKLILTLLTYQYIIGRSFIKKEL